MPQRRYAFTQARKSSLGSKSARRDPEACILRYGESASEESIRKMRHVDAYHLELKYSPSLANRRSLLSPRGDVVLINLSENVPVELSHWIPPIWDETVFDPAHKSAL
jgi:hypothetical protein